MYATLNLVIQNHYKDIKYIIEKSHVLTGGNTRTIRLFFFYKLSADYLNCTIRNPSYR